MINEIKVEHQIVIRFENTYDNNKHLGIKIFFTKVWEVVHIMVKYLILVKYVIQ